MHYVPDNLSQLPDEPEQVEHEYLVSVTVPVTVEVSVTGIDEDDALKEAKEELEKIDIRRHITDYDLSEMEVEQIEHIRKEYKHGRRR